jgi:hypothetical protein
LLEGLELADEMSPAELTPTFFVVAVVGGVVVTGDDTGRAVTEEFPQHLGAATGGDVEESGPIGDQGPEVASFALVLPAGFVDVEGQGGSDVLFDGTDHRLAGLGNPLSGIADGTGGDVEIKEGGEDIDNPPAADAMSGHQIGDGGMNPGAKLGSGDRIGQGSNGLLDAAAAQGMAAILGQLRGDLW